MGGAKRMKKFKLTRDLIKISCFSEPSHAAFKAPIPKVNNLVMSKLDRKKVKEDILEIVEGINKRVLNLEKPFYLLTLRPNVEVNKMDTLWSERVQVDDNGLTGAWVGRSVNSGDIYRTNDETVIFTGFPDWIKKIFSDNEAFFCHNVDTFAQALVNRELCVEYFNYVLNKARELNINWK